MARRHDNLPRMLLTVFAALVCGLLLEAQGLYTWAKRLEVGPLRELALPVTERWHALVETVGLGTPRELALEAKAYMAAQTLPVAANDPAPAATAVAETEIAEAGATPAIDQNPQAATQSATTSLPPMESETPAVIAVATAAPNGNAPSPSAGEPPESTNTTPRSPEKTAQAPTPATSKLPNAADTAPAIDAGRPLWVVLAGDSMMAVGLAPTLTRRLARENDVHVIKAYRSGTGLARPEVYDWLEHYPQMLGGKTPDLVICAMGANDGQNVQVGKKLLNFGTADWDAFYTERLTRYLDMLSQQGVRILWVGIPAMKERRFAKRMQHMNTLVRNVVSRYPNATWMDPNPNFGYVNNAFAQYGITAGGKPIKLRTDDGIHMTDQGAGFLLPPIRTWVSQAALANKPPAPAPAEKQETAAATSAPAQPPPLNTTM